MTPIPSRKWHKLRPPADERQSGVAMVEFAIVLPLLLIILFGIVEFGLVLFNKQVITNASREGARYGIVARVPRRTEAQITNIVNAYCEDYLVTFGTNKTPSINTNSSIDAEFGDPLFVEVSFDYTFLVLPELVQKNFLGSPLTLKAKTVMLYE